jgi:hypothetical protein
MTRRLSHNMKSQAAHWVEETFAALGCPELVKLTTIHWRHMYRELGAASWTVMRTGEVRSGTDFKIILSVRLWPYLPARERYETVVHECCHIVDVYLGNVDGNPHGDSWQKFMRKMGCRPKERYPTMHLTPAQYYAIVPKCTICRRPGHDRRRCPTAAGEELNQVLGNQD